MAVNGYGKKRFAKDLSLAAQEVIDELILVPLQPDSGDLGKAFVMNEVASRIWTLIDGTRRVEDIGQTIVEEFDVSPETAHCDVADFMRRLERMGFVWPA
jgi:hypothetical protein